VSGIVGIFRRDGAPVERSLLGSLTRFLSYRGPDAREVWSDGPVGFGHTMLRTTQESANERQPANLDGRFYITADARLDDRAELETKLDQAKRRVRGNAPDAELILHAYAAWGEQCVRHLRGDFVLAIWDTRRRSLFCARDHFGVKPFYYSDLGDLFLFSDTLDCVRIHPEVSDGLNEAAIADFLLFGLNCDVASTTFRDVRRLPPAHFMTVSQDNVRVQRYWSAPTNGRIRYPRDDDYVEHFQILMRAAVADRLPADRAGIWLSGGMDSSSIAVVARELSRESANKPNFRAYTFTSESLIPDRESFFARRVAEFLQIPIRIMDVDDRPPFDRWDDPETAPSEPVDDPFFSGVYDQYRAISADCRVVFSGEGSDNLMLFQMWPYVRQLFRNGEWRRLFADVPRYLWVRPFPWRGLRQRGRRLFGSDGEPVLPRWIAPDFARRVDIEARWREHSILPRVPGHPMKPKAHASLSLPHWSRLFELADSGVTHCPVEVRYPFLDLRIVNYILALPPFPWSFHKKLLREAMKGRLPEGIRRRPKTPLSSDPVVAMLRRHREVPWLDRARWSEEIDSYVDRNAPLPLHDDEDSEGAIQATRPLCLNFWLQSRARVRYNFIAEALHG
jgi:asparagine synthase (glutamine-hydrolysing)